MALSYIINTIAGFKQSPYTWPYTGGGSTGEPEDLPHVDPSYNTSLREPHGVAMNSRGQLLIADTNNNRILELGSATGTISAKTGTSSDEGYVITVVGTGARGFSGDSGHPRRATLNSPFGVAVDRDNNIFISDFANNRVRRVSERTGVITTVAGDGARDQYEFGAFKGDGGPGTRASLDRPKGVAVDGSGNVYIADMNNHRIRRVAAGTGIITTVAGDGYTERGGLFINWGKGRYGGDGGPATSASLYYPSGVAVDASGNLFIADRSNHRIRRVDARTGVITTVAGTGALGFSGDGGPATNAVLRSPSGVAVDRSGNLFIADSENNRIRVVGAGTGVITTIAGNDTAGFSGDGGPAMRASLNEPNGLCVDTRGNVFITDTKNDRIRILVDSAPIQERIIQNLVRLLNQGVTPNSNNQEFNNLLNEYRAATGRQAVDFNTIPGYLESLGREIGRLFTYEGAVPNGNNQKFNNLLIHFKEITGHDFAFHASPPDVEERALVASIEQLISDTHPDSRDSNYNARMSALLARYRAVTKREYTPSSSRSLLRSSPQVQLRKNEGELSSNSPVSHGEEVSSNSPSLHDQEVSKLITNIENLASQGYTSDNNEELKDLLTRYSDLTGNEYVLAQPPAPVGGRRRRNKKSRRVKKSRGLKKSKSVRKSKK